MTRRPAKSNRRTIVTVALVAVGAIGLYWMSSELMDWLRVTMHGR